MEQFDKVDLSQVDFTPELLKSLPAATARMYRVLPVQRSAKTIVLAMAAMPLLIAMRDDLDSVRTELQGITERDVDFVIADRDQLGEFLDKYY